MSRIIGSLALLLLLIWSGNAAARCWVSTTSVSFGSYDVFAASPTDSTGNVAVVCDQFFTFINTSIGPSSHSGGFNPRQMKLAAGTDLLDYNVYTNAARTQIWGDGTGGTSSVWGIAFRNTTVNRAVYGRIPAGQDVSAGLYTDTLTVTVSW